MAQCISVLVKKDIISKDDSLDNTVLDKFSELKFVQLLRNLSDSALISKIQEVDPTALTMTLDNDLPFVPLITNEFNSALKVRISMEKDKFYCKQSY